MLEFGLGLMVGVIIIFIIAMNTIGKERRKRLETFELWYKENKHIILSSDNMDISHPSKISWRAIYNFIKSTYED